MEKAKEKVLHKGDEGQIGEEIKAKVLHKGDEGQIGEESQRVSPS
ncbi:hypothetical protein [Neobacillus mesonae]|nr:hypothetical protein [Neobacillus mesonae]